MAQGKKGTKPAPKSAVKTPVNRVRKSGSKKADKAQTRQNVPQSTNTRKDASGKREIKARVRSGNVSDFAAFRGRFAGRAIVIIPAAILVLLLILSALYYRPSQIWYREARQYRVMTDQLTAINEYNRAMEQSIASLETTEGIRDYARSVLKLVDKGEHTVIVTRDGQPIADPQDVALAEILSIPQEARPFGVWTPFLDAFFRIELATPAELSN